MQRLTVHLERVPKETMLVKDKKTKKMVNKSFIKNTLAFIVDDEEHALIILGEIEEKQPSNVKKHYMSNIN